MKKYLKLEEQFKHTSTVILTSSEPQMVPLGYSVIALVTCSSWNVSPFTVQFNFDCLTFIVNDNTNDTCGKNVNINLLCKL